MAAFEYRQAQEIRDIFARHGVRYLFIGKSGATAGLSIIAGNVAANRAKDRESLARLKSFREYWIRRGPH